MRKFAIAVVMSGVTLLGSGCASIVSKSKWPVTINSNPSGATVTIKNKQGVEMHKGITPMTVILPSKAGYFQPAAYQLVFEKQGYDPASTSLSARMNGWYIVNVLFGFYGLVGLAVVDPATGAMWKLDDMTCGNLSPNSNAPVEPFPPVVTAPSPGTTNEDPSAPKFEISDFRIVELKFDTQTGKGNVTVDIGGKGFNARLWVVKNIGMICSGKNVVNEAGTEVWKGAKYTILDESIKDGLLTIGFQAVY